MKDDNFELGDELGGGSQGGSEDSLFLGSQ